MHIVSASPERIVARGAGPAPCIAIAAQGARDRFVGAAFRMSDDTELERYTTEFGAQRLAPESIPGGGHGVELFDPSGRSVWLLQGQQPGRMPAAAGSTRGDDQHRPARAARQPQGPHARSSRPGS